jgi:hypothetical protein
MKHINIHTKGNTKVFLATLLLAGSTLGSVAYASNGGDAPPMKPGEGFYETDSPGYQPKNYQAQPVQTTYSQGQTNSNAYSQAPAQATSTTDSQ